jgi:hypothetical protein
MEKHGMQGSKELIQEQKREKYNPTIISCKMGSNPSYLFQFFEPLQ